MKIHVNKVQAAIVVVALLLCFVWGMGTWLYEAKHFRQHADSVINKENDYASNRGKTIAADFRRSLKIMYGLPEVLASWNEVIHAFKISQVAAQDAESRSRLIKAASLRPEIEHINHLLALSRNDFSTDIIWLLDTHGDCIAASNFDAKSSLIGLNFKERAYFSSAMDGDTGFQFAVGKVTHLSGLYFSAPVYDGMSVIGVVVVKVDMEHLAHNIDMTNTLVVDENGVVILADKKTLEMKIVPDAEIKKWSPENRHIIYQTSQFEEIKIQPWPDSRYSRLSKIDNRPEAYVLNITSINAGQLKIYVMAPANEILTLDQDFFGLFLLITLCGSTLVIIVAGILLYVYSSHITRKLLQVQQDELNEAQHIAQMGSWSYDYVTDVLHCSDELLEHFFLLKPTSAVPSIQKLLAQVHPDDRELIKKTYKQSLKGGDGYQIEYRLMRSDGEIRHVVANIVVARNDRGQRLKIAGTCKDVTEELRTLHAIEASEMHLRRVINSSLIGIIQGDENGIVLEMNNAFMNLTGYSRDYVTERKLAWQDLAPLEFRHFDEPQLFGNQTAPLPFEMQLHCQDGRMLDVLIGLAKIEDIRGEWVCFVLDLSERNRVNRMKSEFISVVSHELRTPLTSIRGSLALLEGGVAGAMPEKGLELIKIAHRNSRRLIEIVNDILDMEKLEAGKMVFDMISVDAVALLRQAMEGNESFANGMSVKLVLREFPHEAYIWGDPNRLMQVLTNLISNAVKFSIAGNEVDLTVIKSNNQWRIEVRDHGVGIPESFRPRIFGTFAQAEDVNTRQKGGTGLGLHISKTMVEKMDGHIGFESEEGVGSVFWISFAAM